MPNKTEVYNSNPNLKNAGVKIEFTARQIEEIIKCQQDIQYFFQMYCKIVSVDHGIIPFVPYEYQIRMTDAIINNRFSIHKIPRQYGKTTVAAMILMWYVLFNPNFSIAILANKKDQAIEVLDRIQKAYELLPKWMQQGVLIWNAGNIELENGSKIKAAATSGTSIRGRTQNIIYLDEFAWVPHNEQDAFFASTYPTITSGQTTKVIITSTPNGLDLFYKLWKESELGRNNFVRTETHWSDKDGRDQKWKEEQIKNMGGEYKFRQEFEVEFLGSSLTLIAGSKLSNMVHLVPIKKGDHINIYKNPEKGHTYVICADTATGVEQDASAFVVFDVTETPYEICAVYKCDTIPVLIYPQIIYSVAKTYNDAYVLAETNANLGSQVLDVLHNEFEYENIVMTSMFGRNGRRISLGFGQVKQDFGLCTTASTKQIGCSNLKTMVESDLLMIPDYDIIFELSRFVQNKKKSYSADQGFHDDLAMCLVLFAWMATQSFIKDINNINFRLKLSKQQEEYVEHDIAPVGVFTGYSEDDKTPILEVNPARHKTFEQLLWE